MKAREAAIVSAYTGKFLGDFSVFHGYVEEIMGRPIWTHELCNKAVSDEIKEKSRDDFINLTVD